MCDLKKTLTERFCEDILTFPLAHRQAVANLVMALASDKDAKSVVALSNSPVFHHQYSSISKAIAGLAASESSLKRVRERFQAQWREYFPFSEVNYWQTDVVNIFREHSPCLRGRQYCHKANQVIGANKPVGIGYPLSSVNVADVASGWSLPFDLRRVTAQEDEVVVGAGQIKRLCESDGFAASFHLNACDSRYGVAKYISRVNEIGNLVSVIRLRHGNKVYPRERKATGGAERLYGLEYRLLEASGWKEYRKREQVYRKYLTSLYEKAADEYEEITRVTKKGRVLKIELRRWSAMKMRTKQGHSMKEVEFEVVGLRVLEQASGARVFPQDVFVAVVGPERRRLGLAAVAEVFYHRFDLEVTNRLMKQQLFLESYQTPAVQHLDNWNVLVQEAMWLLWAASGEVEKVCEKWQQYSQPKENKGGRKTPSQTKRGLARLLLTFEREPYLPKKCKKGAGREKGKKLAPRKRYKVVKKWGELEEIVKTRPRQE